MKTCAAAFVIVLLSSVSAVAGQEPLPHGWTAGPVAGNLGSRATVNVPAGYFFLDSRATRTFLEENENIPDGDELGTILRVSPDGDDYWFAVFSYSDTGYIDSSDRNSLDADALMKSMREGSRRGNEARRERGWSTLELEGWHQPPFYDSATNNLTWTTRLSSDGAPIVNHSVRLLGRSGMMSAQLVADVETVDAATREFDEVLQGYTFNAGQRYAEFRTGDKLAGYGLTALIAGGAGAAAVKSGLLQKFWKVLVFGFLGLVAAMKKLLGMFRRSESDSVEPSRA
jgi:uncharacterized membrane-anchored protein